MKLFNKYILRFFLAFLAVLNINVFGQNSFEFVVLPDTQTLVDEFPDVYRNQLEWIAKNKDRFSFVLHVGDITQNNSEKEWRIAKEGLSLLNQKVPYHLALGNHDMGSQPGKFADSRNTSLVNIFFPVKEYIRNSKAIGTFPKSTIDNSCAEYHLVGEDWLVFSLEFGPRNKTINWVNNLIKNYPNHKVIINTHSYMYNDNTLQGGDDWYLPKNYGIGKLTGDETANDGEQLWEKLIKPNKHIIMVFSGHILGSGVGQLVAKNNFGNKVYQMLANYQKNVKGVEKGASGYLRIIKVDRPAKTISVKTYSPWLDKYKTEPDHDFIFKNVEF